MNSLKERINTFESWYKSHPYAMIAIIVATAAFVVFMVMPSPQNASISEEEQARRDSAALHIALMPVDDCIPFYYAQRTGIYDRLGLDLRIKTLQSQLDTDTALARGHVELAYSDLARAIMLQQDSVELRAIAATDAPLQLITARRGRVRQLSQLRERMVAVARHSITDFWSDRLTDTIRLSRADIFRPQINDVRIRIDMLCNGTMDAAFLPEPYASEAIRRGNKQNFTTEGLEPQLFAYLATIGALEDSTRNQQLQILFQGYTEALNQLHQNQYQDTLAVLYKELCHTPDSLLDSLVLHARFMPLHAPRRSDAEAALEWLRSRDKVKTGYTIDSLIRTFPITQ